MQDSPPAVAFFYECLKVLPRPDILQSDNGGEFISAAVNQFCVAIGTKYVIRFF